MCINTANCVLTKLLSQYGRQATYLRDQFLNKQAIVMLPRLQTMFAAILLVLWLLSWILPCVRKHRGIRSFQGVVKAALIIAVVVSLPLFDTIVLTTCATRWALQHLCVDHCAYLPHALPCLYAPHPKLVNRRCLRPALPACLPAAHAMAASCWQRCGCG